MCIIALRWSPASLCPLIVAANRDEFYHRESLPCHHWNSHPGVFGGLDRQAGGTWLGINTLGRFATVTNFRQPGETGTVSRGMLTRSFLTGDQPAADYLQTLKKNSEQYAGFNLLIADHSGLWYLTNRCPFSPDGNSLQQLPPGTYGLSNHLLNTPWPKVKRLTSRFTQAIDKQAPDASVLLKLLHDKWLPAVRDLPKTGIAPKMERRLSSCFISTKEYGTRTSTVLILNRAGQLNWHEQHYGSFGVSLDYQHRTLSLKASWLTSLTHCDQSPPTSKLRR